MGDLDRAACLWSQLPAESRTARLQSSKLAWSTGDYLLWQIEFHVRELAWALSYDKKHPSPRPQPIPTPAQMEQAYKKQASALEVKAQMAKEFGLEE